MMATMHQPGPPLRALSADRQLDRLAGTQAALPGARSSKREVTMDAELQGESQHEREARAARNQALIRSEPRHFAVLPGHVYPDVEVVVRDGATHVVVEKTGHAAEAAEFLDRR